MKFAFNNKKPKTLKKTSKVLTAKMASQVAGGVHLKIIIIGGGE